MTGNASYLLTISFGLSISVGLFLLILFSKKGNSSQFHLTNPKGLSPRMVKTVNLIGGDLLSLVPPSIQKKTMKDKKIDDLFKASGNPWQVTKFEFLVIRGTYALIYGIFIGAACVVIRPDFIVGAFLLFLGALLGWNKPVSTYKSYAKERSIGFKKHLPEMLDYLTMIMSNGNYTLANAIERVLPYLQDSVVKEEFKRVIEAINSGSTTENALNELAERVPSSSLESFVKAVNNANNLNTPMDSLMRARAIALRKDLINEIEMVIQTLPTKTMLAVGPPAIFSLLIIFMVPVVVSLISTL